MIEEYVKKVDDAIEKLRLGDSKLTQQVLAMHGFTPKENKLLLNEILKAGDKYLEIGAHIGSTFVPAMYGNNAQGIALDDFSRQGYSEQDKIKFNQNCLDHNIQNYTCLDRNYFNLTDDDKELIRGTNVYYYDADQIFEYRERSLTYYFDLFSNPVIYISSYWKFKVVQNATKSGLEKTNAVIHKQWELDENTIRKDWWSTGLYIAVLGKP